MRKTRIRESSTTARALARLMSEISEWCYCAGWLIDLEHYLWQHVIGDPKPLAFPSIKKGEVEDLRELSNLAGGWIAWDTEDPGECFVPLEDWEKHHAEWRELEEPEKEGDWK